MVSATIGVYFAGIGLNIFFISLIIMLIFMSMG
jgi:hypothetical protein